VSIDKSNIKIHSLASPQLEGSVLLLLEYGFNSMGFYIEKAVLGKTVRQILFRVFLAIKPHKKEGISGYFYILLVRVCCEKIYFHGIFYVQAWVKRV